MRRWKQFFGTGELLPIEEVERTFPNARRHVRGSVFVSHAGADSDIVDDTITDRLRSNYSPYVVFQYNSRGPAKDDYKQLVLLAMSHCVCAVVVCSKYSSGHEWVSAEVDWLLDHKRPVLLLCLDSTPARDIHPGLGFLGRMRRGIRSYRPIEANELAHAIEAFGLPSFPDLFR